MKKCGEGEGGMADMRQRTASFSLRVLKMLRELPNGVECKGIRRQLTHSATAVGAIYRELEVAEQRVEVVDRVNALRKELAACEFWISLVKGLVSGLPSVDALHLEALALMQAFSRMRKALEANGPSEKG
jgi:four helix bundle protein